MSETPKSLKSDRAYERQGVVWIGWPEQMGDLAKEEVEYHDHFDEDAFEVHQLNSWRNLFYHNILRDQVKQLPKGSQILEIGAGNGAEARELKSDYKLTLTDISPKTLQRLEQKIGSENLEYVAVDGVDLPFVDNYFDGLYMVAVWHHLSDYAKGLSEAARVLKPGGQLVIAVEPNSFYHWPIKILRPLLCRLVGTTESSKADEEMHGFSYADIKRYFGNGDWQDIKIRPMWLLAGWLHYGLEFVYRAFKLKNRIKVPAWLEKTIVGLDEVLFLIPGFKHLGWHWIVSARKSLVIPTPDVKSG